jgi:hypothetical protein
VVQFENCTTTHSYGQEAPRTNAQTRILGADDEGSDFHTQFTQKKAHPDARWATLSSKNGITLESSAEHSSRLVNNAHSCHGVSSHRAAYGMECRS